MCVMLEIGGGMWVWDMGGSICVWWDVGCRWWDVGSKMWVVRFGVKNDVIHIWGSGRMWSSGWWDVDVVAVR